MKTMLRAMLGALLLVMLAMVAGAADFVVIVNNANSTSEISSSELKNIYLGKKTSWGNGTKVDVAVLEGGKVHEAFCSGITSKSASQFANFWKTALFTGTGVPPKSARSDAEMIDFVRKNPGAIGYISASSTPSGVKVVSVQ
jgi:ABC-type phosphate transport system substrate-binding protein